MSGGMTVADRVVVLRIRERPSIDYSSESGIDVD